MWIIFLTLKFIWVLSILFWNFSSSLPEQLKDNIYMLKVWLPKQQYYDCTWFLAVLGIIKLEYISIINIKRLSIYFLFLPIWLDCLSISLGFLKIWYLQSLIPNIYISMDNYSLSSHPIKFCNVKRRQLTYKKKKFTLFFIRLIRRRKITQIIIDIPNYFYLNAFTLF